MTLQKMSELKPLNASARRLVPLDRTSNTQKGFLNGKQTWGLINTGYPALINGAKETYVPVQEFGIKARTSVELEA